MNSTNLSQIENDFVNKMKSGFPSHSTCFSRYAGEMQIGQVKRRHRIAQTSERQ
jgi:hypothetical protein